MIHQKKVDAGQSQCDSAKKVKQQFLGSRRHKGKPYSFGFRVHEGQGVGSIFIAQQRLLSVESILDFFLSSSRSFYKELYLPLKKILI